MHKDSGGQASDCKVEAAHGSVKMLTMKEPDVFWSFIYFFFISSLFNIAASY